MKRHRLRAQLRHWCLRQAMKPPHLWKSMQRQQHL
jgi:hypothetical protein